MQLGHPKLEPTREHVIPQSRGGRDIIIACIQCNMIKADMLPEQWASYMAANPGWWLLTKAERRARARQPREAARLSKWGPRARQRQGSPKPGPVVVPPELIWAPKPTVPAGLMEQANEMRPYERSQFLLKAHRDVQMNDRLAIPAPSLDGAGGFVSKPGAGPQPGGWRSLGPI